MQNSITFNTKGRYSDNTAYQLIKSSGALLLNYYSGSIYPSTLIAFSSGSTTITGSVNISSVLNLTPLDPLPTGTVGSLATSGSLLYFHDGGSWREVSLI